MGQKMEARNEEVGREGDTIENAKGDQAAKDGRGKKRGSLLFTFNSCLSMS